MLSDVQGTGKVMAYINGGQVLGMTLKDEYAFISRRNRHLLLENRSKHYHYLIDRMVMVCPDLRELLSYVRDNISTKWYSTIRGSLVGLMLIRYTHYFLYPQQYSHRGDLILFANYFLLQQYLFRIAGVLVNEYNFPNKYYGFKIKKDKLYKLSELFYDELQSVVTEKLVPHYKKLQG